MRRRGAAVVAVVALVALARGVSQRGPHLRGADPRRGRAAERPTTTVDARGETSWARASTAGTRDLDTAPTTGVDPSTREPMARSRALRDAARRGTPEAVRWLAERASEGAMSAHAAAALGEVADPRAVDELARVALDAGEVAVRAQAIRALTASGGRAYATDLAALVRDVAQPARVRVEAALALSRFADGSTAAPLAAALEQLVADHTPVAEQLRVSIVLALGTLDADDARVALEQHARRSLSQVERAMVRHALDRTRVAD